MWSGFRCITVRKAYQHAWRPSCSHGLLILLSTSIALCISLAKVHYRLESYLPYFSSDKTAFSNHYFHPQREIPRCENSRLSISNLGCLFSSAVPISRIRSHSRITLPTGCASTHEFCSCRYHSYTTYFFKQTWPKGMWKAIIGRHASVHPKTFWACNLLESVQQLGRGV